MTLIITLEAMAGDRIEDVAEEMCAVASQLGIITRVQFNDVKMYVKPGSDSKVVVEKFYGAVSSDSKHKTFFIHPYESPQLTQQ